MTRRRRSIRARTTQTAMLVMGVALTITAVALVVFLKQSLVRDLEARARLRLTDVAALAERGELPTTLAGGDEDGTVAQVLANGTVVAQSQVVLGTAPLAHFVPAGTGVSFRTVHNPPLPNVGVARVAARRITTSRGPAVVYVAASLEPVDDTINPLTKVLAVVVPGLVLLVGACTWWLVGRTLQPVEAIRAQVADISARRLDQRVLEPATDDEIHRLAETMNAMLARLEEAAGRQRRFVSDAAHELRSPLATLRTELDVAARRDDPAESPALIDRLGSTTHRMERLVEDLLVMAVADEQGVVHRRELDLDDLVLRQLEPLRATSRLALDVTALHAVRVLGDPSHLERVVANLVDNAAAHATSTIAVELRAIGDMAELVIADDGPGIAVESRERIFDRFARADEARDRRTGGAGLGLAIARRIVEDHGGTICVEDAPRGARVVVRLPVGGDRAGEAEPSENGESASSPGAGAPGEAR